MWYRSARNGPPNRWYRPATTRRVAVRFGWKESGTPSKFTSSVGRRHRARSSYHQVSYHRVVFGDAVRVITEAQLYHGHQSLERLSSRGPLGYCSATFTRCELKNSAEHRRSIYYDKIDSRIVNSNNVKRSLLTNRYFCDRFCDENERSSIVLECIKIFSVGALPRTR